MLERPAKRIPLDYGRNKSQLAEMLVAADTARGIPSDYGRKPARLRAATSDFSQAGSETLPSSTAVGF